MILIAGIVADGAVPIQNGKQFPCFDDQLDENC